MQNKKDEGNFVSVAGKISTWSYGRIMEILRRLRLTIYIMIQNMCDCIIRFMDDKHNLTPESEKVMNMFEHMIGWEDNFNLADPTTKPEINEATYYLVDSKGKKGVRVMHVERPFFGKWTQNFNVRQILEKFFCSTFPQLYRRYRYIAMCRDCCDLFELFSELIGELEEEQNKRELRRPFEDADRGDFGQHVHTDRNRKRPYEASQDTLFKDELI